MTTTAKCVACGAALPPPARTGRARLYCDSKCRNRARRQGLTPSSRSTYLPWTEHDIAYAADESLTAPDVAQITGHSVGSVRTMRHKLRRGWQSGRSMWSEDEDAFLHNAPNLTAAQIATHLGRSADAVVQRRNKIGCAPGTSQQAKPWVVDDRTLLAKTCSKCGLFLGAEWFGRISYHVNNGAGGRWQSHCARCRREKPSQKNRRRYTPSEQRAANARAITSTKRLQALTIPNATRGGYEWTERDMDVLADPDHTLLEKALTLKRTYIAVSRQAYTHGFKSKIGLGDISRGVWQIIFPDAPAPDVDTHTQEKGKAA